MKELHLVAAVTAVLLVAAYKKMILPAFAGGDQHSPKALCLGQKAFFLVLAGAFLLRIILAVFNRGHETDMNCFIGWANLVFEKGFSGFYTAEAFTDYPPGYMYILYLIGALRHFFHIGDNTSLSIVLTKLPAILCDLAAGWVIYKVAQKKFQPKGAVVLSALYLFCPAILFNSSIWGQVDAVFTLCAVLMCYWIAERKLPSAYFAFAAGILIKPQMLIFTPILLYGIVNQVFLEGYRRKEFLRQLKWGLLAVSAMIVLVLPFGFSHVLKQYLDTLGSYPFATINGYNLWAFFGLNWVPQDGKFLFFTYSQWGTAFIVLLLLVTTYYCMRNRKDKSNYFLGGAFLVTAMFMLSVRMHERYMFPALALLLLAFACRPRKGTFCLFALFSIYHFYNTAHVYFYYDYQNFDSKAPFPILAAGAGLLIFLLFLYQMLEKQKTKEEAEKGIQEEAANGKEAAPLPSGFAVSRRFDKIGRKDIIILLSIMAVYSCFALHDLGKNEAPETALELKAAGDSIVLDLGEEKDIANISFFLGNYEERKFSLEVSNSREDGYHYITDVEMARVFAWGGQEVSAYGRYLRLTLLSEKAVVLELVLKDRDGQICFPANSLEFPALFDEQDKYVERSTFRDSTYFDEVYHARTAYEYIHGLYSYENTHPPLGKILISLGIRIFGMNPFGWRIMGTLFGIAMVPLIYLFARRLLKKTWLAAFTCILFTFDFMHFTQTRIATIDVFITFFILLMYYFMYRYVNTSFYDTPLKKTFIPLGLSGIFMGIGIACKWTGIYAGCGLAILFFWSLYKRYQEYRYASLDKDGETDGISHRHAVDCFGKYTVSTIGFCILFFVLIPAVIYLLSYLPFVNGAGDGLLPAMLKNQASMFSYHAGVEATHPYSSWWYQWPIMYRPIWYYSGQVSETISEGISAFGNPLVWWTGIPAFFYMLYLGIRRKDKTAAFLCVAYLAQYVPWFLVTRITFIYHYFPCVPFVTLMIGYGLYRLALRRPVLKKAAFLYAAAAVGLFLLFYPVLSGQPVDKNLVYTFLRWFKSWVLIA